MKTSFKIGCSSSMILKIVYGLTIVLVALMSTISGQELEKSSKSGTILNYLAILRQTSRQSIGYITNLAEAIPFTKVLLAGGALLSLFFIFVRLLVVLGPIILFGTLTRESTDVSDYLKLLIEFYNQIVQTLDEQISNPGGGLASGSTVVH